MSFNKSLWLIPLILSLAAHFNVLQNGFGWDDEVIVPNLKETNRSWTVLLPRFDSSSPLSEDLPLSTERYYRPLIGFSYQLDFLIWGGGPFGFHFSVWLFHGLNAGLVFFLARRLMPGGPARTGRGNLAPTRSGDPPDRPYRLIPLIAASLFAVHPIHAEAVAWIAGRNDVFCTTFLLASAIFYLRSQGPRPLVWFSLSMISFYLALLTKELAVAFLLIFPLIDYLAIGSGEHKVRPYKNMGMMNHAPTIPHLRFTIYHLRVLPPLLILGLYFYLRSAKMAVAYGGTSAGTVFSGSSIGTAIAAYGLYLKQMLWPYPQNPFMDSIPSSWAWILFSVFLLAVVGGGFLFALWRRLSLPALALGWTGILLLPGVSVAVIRVAATPAAERYAYAATVGFAMAAAWMIGAGADATVRRGMPARKTWTIAASFIAVWFLLWGAQSWKRNAVWKSPLTFWEAAVAAAPLSGGPYRELGKHYDGTHPDDEVEAAYRRAVEVEEKLKGPNHPDVADGLHLLATFHYQRGRYEKAEPLYERALRIRRETLAPGHPDLVDTLNNLAVLYYTQGLYAKAKPLYREAIAIYDQGAPGDPLVMATGLNNLGAVYQAEKDFREAEHLFRRSIEMREKAAGPDSADVASGLNNLAAVYYAQGRQGEAEGLLRRSLAIKEKNLGPDHPDLAPTLYNLASMAYGEGRYEAAIPLFERSIRIREKALGPDHPKLADNLENYARALRKIGRNEDATQVEERLRKIRNGM